MEKRLNGSRVYTLHYAALSLNEGSCSGAFNTVNISLVFTASAFKCSVVSFNASAFYLYTFLLTNIGRKLCGCFPSLEAGHNNNYHVSGKT